MTGDDAPHEKFKQLVTRELDALWEQMEKLEDRLTEIVDMIERRGEKRP